MTVFSPVNLGYDPYLYMALSVPNANSPQFRGQSQNSTQVSQQKGATQAQEQPQAPTQTATENIKDTVTFKGSEEANKKGSTAGKWVLRLATVAAVAYGGYKCHVKGVGEGMYAKILDGAEKYFGSTKDKVFRWLATFRK